VRFLLFPSFPVLDSLSYLVSACLLGLIGGAWQAPSEETAELKQRGESAWDTLKRMNLEGLAFLGSNACGAFVLIKTSGALIYGAGDIVQVAFSEAAYGEEANNNNGSSTQSAVRLGYLFASSGVGCIVGPLISDYFTQMDIPASHQRACLWGLGVTAFSCFAMSVPSSFLLVCLFNAIRTAGGNVISIDSTLLVLKYTPADMLGRVTSVESILVNMSEGLMSYVCGVLMDRYDLDAQKASFGMGLIGSILLAWWVSFHLLGRGGNSGQKTPDLAPELPTEETSLLA
jgi:hypothetical protein